MTSINLPGDDRHDQVFRAVSAVAHAYATLTSWYFAEGYLQNHSYAALCDVIGVSISEMQALQDGSAEWTVGQMATAARLLGVPPTKLAEVWQDALAEALGCEFR